VRVAPLALGLRADIHRGVDGLAGVVPASADLHVAVAGAVVARPALLAGAVVAGREDDGVAGKADFPARHPGVDGDDVALVVTHEAASLCVVVDLAAGLLESVDQVVDHLLAFEPDAPGGVAGVWSLVLPFETHVGEPLEGMDRPLRDGLREVGVGPIVGHLHDVRVEVRGRVVLDVELHVLVEFDVFGRDTERLGELGVSTAVFLRCLLQNRGRGPEFERSDSRGQSSDATADDDDVLFDFFHGSPSPCDVQASVISVSDRAFGGTDIYVPVSHAASESGEGTSRRPL
jgi:hypothetical protein